MPVLRKALALCGRIGSAHVDVFLGVPVRVGADVMVDLRLRVHLRSKAAQD